MFFGARGSQEFEDYAVFDLAATYGVPVWQSLRPWVRLEVLNLLNNQQLKIASISPDGRTLNLDLDNLPEADRYFSLAQQVCAEHGVDPESLVVLPFLD